MKRLLPAVCALLLLPLQVLGENKTALTLGDAYLGALEHNHGLQSMEFNLRAEREGVREAWAALMPQVDAMASYGWSEYKRDYGGSTGELTETDTPSRYDVALNQVVYSRRSIKNVARARAAAALSGEELEAYRTHIGFLALDAWLEASRFRAEAAIVEREVQNHEKRLEQLDSMREHGFASRADSLEAKARLDEVRAELISLQSSERAAVKHLEAVTGIELGSRQLHPVTDGVWRSTLMWLERDWHGIAMEHSGAIRRARSETFLSEAVVQTEKGAHWPELSLSARYNKNDTFSTNVLEENRIELQLRIPIYHGGGTSARVRQAKERMHSSRYQLQDVENTIRVEISKITEDLRGSHGRIQSLQAALESAEAALQASEQGFLGGVRNLNELLDSRNRYSRVERSLVSEQHNNLALYFRLRMVAGSLTPADIAQVSAVSVAR